MCSRGWIRVLIASPGMTGCTEPMPEDDAREWIAQMRVLYPEISCDIDPGQPGCSPPGLTIETENPMDRSTRT
jgi:hypothetical protein